MTPLPVENTGRLVVHYTANAENHSVLFRFGTPVGPPPEAFYDRIDEFFQACQPLMPSDWAISGADRYNSGSLVSVPDGYAWSAVTGTGTPQASEKPAFFSTIGRGTSGRRARIYMLGTALSPADEKSTNGDYRVYEGESVNVAAVIFAATQLEVVTIFGDAVFWKDYVNLGYHSYWQKRVRG